jgi:hypothetical protein
MVVCAVLFEAGGDGQEVLEFAKEVFDARLAPVYECAT